MSNGLDPDLGPIYLQRSNYQLTTKEASSKKVFKVNLTILSHIQALFCYICESLVKEYIQHD